VQSTRGSAYSVDVRLTRRRRPAGSPQVPEVEPTELLFEGVFVLRLGPGRILLDLPTGSEARGTASVWFADDPPGWARVPWPVDAGSNRPIAPLDLWSGHVIEFSHWAGEEWSACYACVLGARESALVAMFANSSTEAIHLASDVHIAWSRAQVERTLSSLTRGAQPGA
jgi:hypothetical protein